MDAQLSALNAYQGATNLGTENQGPQFTGSGQFAGLVSNVLDETITSVRAGEQAASGAVAGEVGLEELAMAVNNAEVALKTVVAVRDRIITAYQDIMKMPI